MDEGKMTASALRFRRMRKRFLVVATVALMAVGAVLGTTFTADTGSASISVSNPGGGSGLLFPVASSTSSLLPSTANAYIAKNSVNGAVADGHLQYTTASGLTGATAYGFQSFNTSNVVTPTWSVVKNSSGSVSGGGDLAVIDADTTDAGSAGHVLVTVYVTNLNLLQGDYSSFAWPINVWESTDHGASWTPATVSGASLPQYLTNTSGYLTLTLPTGTHLIYDLTMDAGGSFYAIDTLSDGTHERAPSFYFTLQPLS